jgi:hypothetical protein
MPNSLIETNTFESLSLTGSKGKSVIGLFTDEANVLRTELVKILQTKDSLESWNFIKDLHKINLQKDWSERKIRHSLDDLIAKYIVDNAPEQINIGNDLRTELIAYQVTRTLTPHHFKPALLEVFRAIIVANLTGEEVDRLKESERLIRAAQSMEKALGEVLAAVKPAAVNIKPNDHALPPIDLIAKRRLSFFALKSKLTGGQAERLINSTNHLAKTAEQSLFALFNNPKISNSEFKTELLTIRDSVTQKLDTIVMAIENLKIHDDVLLKQLKGAFDIIGKILEPSKKIDMPNLTPKHRNR